MAAARKKPPRTAAAKKKTPKRKNRKRDVAPVPRRHLSRVTADALDLRDRPYQPTVARCPRAEWFPSRFLDVKDQGDTNACTGFALSTVVEHLLACSQSHMVPISGFMLYSMARRYDEFPGSANNDTGSSLRGALKGWHHHGASGERLWRTPEMPKPANEVAQDWWLDAAQRPLGAYYRIDTRSITDMHVALNEVGMLYASAVAHAGWDEGHGVRDGDLLTDVNAAWVIPQREVKPEDGGHAFAIVGYNRQGFLIQNSWTSAWGSGGFAILSYRDWLENAMDCWVAQLGVVTGEHRAVATSTTLRTHDQAGKIAVTLASDAILRDREISPFIINMENNGKLSNSGVFRTQPSDVQSLVSFHLAEARKKWGMKPTDTVDVAVYAHGGLTDEDTAAKTASAWIPALYERRIFPIFLMWETGFWKTLTNIFTDYVQHVPRTTGGAFDKMKEDVKRWWNERLERAAAQPGTAVWGEMKQNADAITRSGNHGDDDNGGGVLLYNAFRDCGELNRIRLHLIGHSAGSIVHSFLVDRLAQAGMSFENVVFMAPAVRVDTFSRHLVPWLKSGRVGRLTQFHLSDAAELADPTCGPYRRSLLYLVSNSFEGGKTTPILGMERYFDAWLAGEGQAVAKRVKAVTAPTADSGATTHGGFDDDRKTRDQVIDVCTRARAG